MTSGARLGADLRSANPGSTYNTSADCERRNLDIVEAICDLDELAGPLGSGCPRRSLITFVEDRPGYDKCYAIDASKMLAAAHDLDRGLRRTVQWCLDNEDWWRPLIAHGDALARRGLIKMA